MPLLSLLPTMCDFQQGMHLTCIVVCVLMQMFFHSRNAVKIAIGSSLFFAILMGAEFSPAVFAYSEEQVVACLVPQGSQKLLEVNQIKQ